MKKAFIVCAALVSCAAALWITSELMAGTGYPLTALRGGVQPVDYPHKKHLALGMECAACHTGAYEGTHAGIPPTAFCATCHRAGASDRPGAATGTSAVPALGTTGMLADHAGAPTSPAMEKYLGSGEEIPWAQFQRAPRHVYFSHRRHASMAKIECATCHGDMKQQEHAVTAPVFSRNLYGMNTCVDCHRREHVSTDCMACHR